MESFQWKHESKALCGVPQRCSQKLCANRHFYSREISLARFSSLSFRRSHFRHSTCPFLLISRFVVAGSPLVEDIPGQDVKSGEYRDHKQETSAGERSLSISFNSVQLGGRMAEAVRVEREEKRPNDEIDRGDDRQAPRPDHLPGTERLAHARGQRETSAQTTQLVLIFKALIYL